MKNVYFLSDAHLGSRAIPHRRMQERRLVNFLDSIKHKAAAVYLLGDIFDFWHEYKTVVPKGYTRLLGKISELTDNGVEVHFFIGNHDLWMGDYLEKECGVTLHRSSAVVEIYGKVFVSVSGTRIATSHTDESLESAEPEKAMDLTPTTKSLRFSAPSSTTASASALSPPYIPAGEWPSDWNGHAAAA